MRALGDLQPETLKTASARPWVWLLDATLEQTVEASPCVRLTNLDEDVVYDGNTYRTYPFSVEAIQSSASDMPSLRIVLSNVSRVWSRYLFAGGGMVGQAVTLTLTHIDHLDAGTSWTFQVGECDIADGAFSIALQVPDFWQVAVPADIYRSGRCRWRYRSDECGYLGTLGTCNKTLSDCVAHGDDMVAAGRPRRHPRVYGGFPGIPT